MHISVVIAASLLIIINGVHAAEVYRWVDNNGKVHYSDTPPPTNAKNAEVKKVGGNAIDVDKLPYATRDAMKKSPVTLYANNCGTPCDQAKQLLTKRGIPFSLKNPESSTADADALTKLIGSLEVPVMVVGSNSPLKGFEEGAWTSALNNAGYPTTASIINNASSPKNNKSPEANSTPSTSGGNKPAPKY